MTIFIIHTDNGDLILDNKLNLVTSSHEFQPQVSVTLNDTALAPREDWDEWNLTLSDQEIVEMIKPAIRSKMTALYKEFEHYHERRKA